MRKNLDVKKIIAYFGQKVHILFFFVILFAILGHAFANIKRSPEVFKYEIKFIINEEPEIVNSFIEVFNSRNNMSKISNKIGFDDYGVLNLRAYVYPGTRVVRIESIADNEQDAKRMAIVARKESVKEYSDLFALKEGSVRDIEHYVPEKEEAVSDKKIVVYFTIFGFIIGASLICFLYDLKNKE